MVCRFNGKSFHPCPANINYQTSLRIQDFLKEGYELLEPLNVRIGIFITVFFLFYQSEWRRSNDEFRAVARGLQCRQNFEGITIEHLSPLGGVSGGRKFFGCSAD